jgi:predicted PurR-regulated permease PerM
MDSPSVRKTRANILYGTGALLFVALAVGLVWALRAIIVPLLVGALAAYIVIPVVNFMERRGLNRNVAILLLFGVLFVTVFLAVRQVEGLLPDDQQKLILRIRIEYKINQNYARIMGLDDTLRKGNTIYSLLGQDLDPLITRFNVSMFPDQEEREALARSRESGVNPQVVTDDVFQLYVANAETMRKLLQREAGDAQSPAEGNPQATAPQDAPHSGGMLHTVGEIASLWIVTPFVFLFLLLDNGQSKRTLIRAVPNRFFEMTLNLMHDVDQAIGSYVRGTLLECALVGITYLISLLVIGFDIQWALLISLVTGIANAIPFVGPLFGLAMGMAYALMADSVHPLFPFINTGNLWLCVLLSVGLAKALDDGVFQPVVLGRAVHLHPIVVTTAIIGGEILFGVAGMLFAIPAIVVFKVLVSSTLKQLKAYYFI